MGTKPTILVVEDDALLRMVAADTLEENGFAVVDAANADAALKLLETREDVRLLFTDPNARFVRRNGTRAPGSRSLAPRSLDHHVRSIKPTEAEIPDHGHFLGKPYRAKELLGEVNDMIGNSRNERTRSPA